MRLHDLIMKMDRDTPVCIEHGTKLVVVRYDTVEELVNEYLFYADIKDREIRNIWYSKNLYQCLVINIY